MFFSFAIFLAVFGIFFLHLAFLLHLAVVEDFFCIFWGFDSSRHVFGIFLGCVFLVASSQPMVGRD